ncbi:MAG TPA: histidine kinase dimerization/phospho-acceptor domain-containing protein [Candidatus Dormibacteraeota bacterium]|nr:histidine kinase dimerization/phospho-acceptor domain-containing protein [Candidatus Dormibacteraeota bacterium]
MTIWIGRVPPLARFGVLALLPVVALGFVLGRALNTDVQQRYLDSARQSATLITQVGIQPLLTAQQLALGLTGDEVAAVDLRLQGASVSEEVTRLKVWNRLGTIVYSDNHALIGRSFAIDDDLHDALNGTSKASITDGHDEENSGDNLAGPLVQVYVPLVFEGSTSPSGAFELYLPYAPVQAAIDRESQQLYVFLAAGLTLFYISMFPLVLLAISWQRRAEAAALANMAGVERLNRLKSEFLVNISHQFRTAMVGIEGFSELIKDADQLDLDEVKAFARDIHHDAQRLDRAFEDMVELDQKETSRAN